MRRSKHAGSQAGWALITGGVSTARVEVHRIHQLLNKAINIIEDSPEKEHIYQVAGDLIQAVTRRMGVLETSLDATSYALSKMGEDHLKDRLPISQRALVDETVEGAKAFGVPMVRDSVVQRVVAKYFGQDLQ